MKTCKEDKPLGIQITGKEIKDYGKIVSHLREYGLVDVNCGCPSIRIAYNTGAGSYLLKKPAKIGGIVKVLKKEGLTVTAKIRLGFKKNNVFHNQHVNPGLHEAVICIFRCANNRLTAPVKRGVDYQSVPGFFLEL